MGLYGRVPATVPFRLDFLDDPFRSPFPTTEAVSLNPISKVSEQSSRKEFEFESLDSLSGTTSFGPWKK
ncbi:hypothetical protein FH972_016845 [Carpinus fangiana]|uniref:Uncharacterized protein n=1 Tax=Carpinus fangiana TaxID=176857 RepID=A0A5N6RHL7_9ROSI|nr:hypothetical protein FH972_016845 [Carpinus fangiana]